MKKLFMISQLFIAMILTLSCEKVVEVDVPPQLEVVVIDSEGNSVEGADVTLYLGEDNWTNRTGAFLSSRTNNSGNVVFENLSNAVYFFYVKKDNKSNTNSVSSFETPLSKNEKKVVRTVIK